MPKPPKITVVVPAADQSSALWRYTTTRPDDAWFKPGFDDSVWKEGSSGFGTKETPGSIIGTVWNTPQIWLRREFQMPSGSTEDLAIWLHHDEDAEVYINGVVVLKVAGWTASYDVIPLNEAGRAAIKPGKNLVAIHCKQSQGGQFIDFGLVRVERQ